MNSIKNRLWRRMATDMFYFFIFLLRNLNWCPYVFTASQWSTTRSLSTNLEPLKWKPLKIIKHEHLWYGNKRYTPLPYEWESLENNMRNMAVDICGGWQQKILLFNTFSHWFIIFNFSFFFLQAVNKFMTCVSIEFQINRS